MLTIGLLATLACREDEPAPAAEAADATTISDAATISCANDPRKDTYTANLEKAGASGVYRFTLLSATPAPPIRGTNSWSLRLTDTSGAVLSGATVDISPYMPDHGHGPSVKAAATEEGDHSYTVAPLYFFMPGLWQVTFKASVADKSDTAVFTFCVEG